MSVVSYRIYCEECSNEIVIRERDMDDHPWEVISAFEHKGLCPACNPAVDVADDSEYARQHEEVAFESLDNIGNAGAENLREAGFVTRQDVANASDDELLDVSWIGEGGLDSIRTEIARYE